MSKSDIEKYVYDIPTMINIIGSGNYSIVVSPVIPIKCSNLEVYIDYTDKDDTDVSKLIKNSNNNDENIYDNEMSILLHIINIESYTSFTPMIKGASSFRYEHIMNEQLNLDLGYENPDDKIYQIIFANGGIPLNKLENMIPFDNFIRMFKKMMEGIRTLQRNNIIHRDIKPSNILISKDSQFNIIDFGLSCHVSQLYNKKDNFMLSYMYMYHPPEFYIIYLLYEEQDKNPNFKENLAKVFNQIIPSKLEYFYDEHYFKYNLNEPYNIYSYTQSFLHFYKDIKKRGINDISEIITEEFSFKADIFGISFILKTLKKFILFETIYNKKKYHKLFNMTYVLNPYERASIDDIISYINSIL